jgi:hypothetical protein
MRPICDDGDFEVTLHALVFAVAVVAARPRELLEVPFLQLTFERLPDGEIVIAATVPGGAAEKATSSGSRNSSRSRR